MIAFRVENGTVVSRSHREARSVMQKISLALRQDWIALPLVVLILATSPAVLSGQSIAEKAQSLNIGFNGPDRQLPYAKTFYAATNAYYRSIGKTSMPGTRHCHAYLSWDVATEPVNFGNRNQEGTRAWFEDWLKHAQGECDEALLTFKYIDGVSNGKGSPTTAAFEAAFELFQNLSWSYTGWKGTFAFTPWNEPNNGARSGDGLGMPLDPRLAADYYLAIRKHCVPSSCLVAAGDFASNGHMGDDFIQRCKHGVTELCTNATYMDRYKYYLATDASSYGLGNGSSFRPEIFAYHAWDDINDYINQTHNCDRVDNHRCTTWVLLNSLSTDSWDKSEIWDTEVGAGQNPQTNPEPVTQACAASFLLRLTATASTRITRIYYTRPYENDGEHWSLFGPAGTTKPAFTVLANRDTEYAPPNGKRCP